jgi:AhpC/TSA family
VYEQWKRSGVKFVGIGLLDKKEACLAFVRRHRLSFPNGYDGDGAVAKLYGFTYQPYWAVIDKNGRLLTTGFGPPNEEILVTTIKQLVGR